MKFILEKYNYIFHKIKQLIVIIVLFCAILPDVFAQPQQKTIPQPKQQQIQTFKQNIKEYQRAGNKRMMAHYENKIAYIYWEYNYGKQAITHFNNSLKLNRQIKNQNAYRSLYTNLGMLYSDLMNYEEALKYFRKSLEEEQKTGDKRNIIAALNNIALVQSYQKKYNEAIKTLQQSLELAQSLNDVRLIRACYGELADNYEKIGDQKNWVKYSKLFATFDKYVKEEDMEKFRIESQIKVARANAEKRAKEAELSLKNLKLQLVEDSLDEVEKINRQKQIELNLLKKEKELQEKNMVLQEQKSRLRTERIIRYSLLGLFVLVGAFTLLLLRENKAKKLANKQLAARNKELNEKNMKIEEQSALLEKQNLELDKKNKQITASINYARRIQEAILPSKKAILQNFPDSFIFYRPKDIVSGDFYWFTKKDDKLLIAAVDCTGHSIPGAFMSMIGNTLLNEIVNEKHITKPSEVLNQLNKGIIQALQQEDGGADDGMDITLCCIDKNNRRLQFACANHLSYVVTPDNNGNSELQTIEGDIYSIGGPFMSLRRKNVAGFTDKTIELKNNTVVYLFSDGFQDQFGGVENTKFMSQRFKKLLYDNHEKDMHDQQLIMETAFDEWKGDYRQIDDVLLIGLRISY